MFTTVENCTPSLTQWMKRKSLNSFYVILIVICLKYAFNACANIGVGRGGGGGRGAGAII